MSISEADRQLFRAQVADAKPLRDDHKISVTSAGHSPTLPAPQATSRPDQWDAQAWVTATIDTPVAPETLLKYHWDRFTRQQRRVMQQGALRIDAQVDLHQCTVTQAYEQLMQFIQYCRHETYPWGLVIHGKGLHSQQPYPILKNYVNQWLRQIAAIKAFCSAHSRHGGAGALYVFFI